MSTLLGSKRPRPNNRAPPPNKHQRLSPTNSPFSEVEPGFVPRKLWEYDPATDFAKKSKTNVPINLPDLAELIYGVHAIKESFLKIPMSPEDITKNLIFKMGKDLKAFGFSNGWKSFDLKANMPGGTTKVTVTSVLEYENSAGDTEYTYLYTYVSLDGTIYTDVFINFEDGEFIDGEEREVFTKKHYIGPLPKAQKGPILNPHNWNYPNRPPKDKGISVVTDGGRRKTYKTRKHKRTRRGRATPRKHGTTPRTRRR